MDNVVLFYDKDRDKVVKGNVIYNESWYDEWVLGNKDPEIVRIEFDEGDAPDCIKEEDIQKIYDEEFEKKMGDFCKEKEKELLGEGELTFYDKEGNAVNNFHVTSGTMW